LSLTTSWAGYFSSMARQRGREYFDRGRVTPQPAEGGELARATVRGQNEYTVVIRDKNAKAAVSCTCPAFSEGHYCKHVWATLLSLERQGDGAAEGEGRPLDDINPSAPKARKRDASPQRPQREAEPQWLSRLSLLSPSRHYQPATPASPLIDAKQIFYVVSADLSQQHGGLVVEVRHRATPRGGWGGLKPFKISNEVLGELLDPIDRELCGLLLGATWVDQYEAGDWSLDHRRRSAFRLPAGTWRPLVKRMIDARRCVIETPQALPRMLEWDDQPQNPWVLWMVGTHGDEGLTIGVELRRGRQRANVNEPELILGGPDGMVFLRGKAAAFDDRDALRWVSHFREDERRGRTVAPLVVPPRDVAKFVERLYLLPDLPEIDLPTDVAFAERQVTARPCIDIVSPPALPHAPPSKQLTAKAWFEYGGLRVEPGQSGRFVAAAADGSAATVDEMSLAAPEAVVDEDDEFAAERAVERNTEGFNREPARAADRVVDEAPAPQVGAPGLIRRDLRFERIAMESLAALGFRANPVVSEHNLVLPVRAMPPAVTALISRGWSVRADRRVIRAAATPRLTIRSGVDWFELHGGINFATEAGEQFVSLPDILAAARAGQNMITLSDGTQGMLPEEWLRQHGLLAAIGKTEGDHLLFKNSQAALLDVLLDQQSLVDVDEKFGEARRRLREFDKVAPAEAPAEFHGQLRPYQKEGLGWLQFLQWFGMGGILADDMGLGKTVQVLAMLQGAASGAAASAAGAPLANQKSEIKNQTSPSLVVAPRSVVFNWLDEAAKFTPGLRVMSYAGTERNSLLDNLGDVDVIVTSYGLLRRDIAKLREINFNYTILDEAQAIKNPGSQVAKASRLLQARHRLALTGTPVENHLGDLWSIFEYLNPGMLGSATRFADLVRGTRGGPQAPPDGAASAAPQVAPPPTEPGDDEMDDIELTGSMSLDDARHMDIARAASRALRPYILRRTKQQVLTELPEKTEQTIICEMDHAQRKVYDDLLKYYRGTLLSKIDSGPAGASAGGASSPSILGGGAKSGMPMMVLEALLRLRQAACHPGLIDDKRTDQPSAKLEALLENLAELTEEGHKALVFSQFTSMLAIVRKRLDATGIKYEYLDGKTQDRKSPVQRFQNDDKCPVFLISLKAGGLGLNLTAADYVFILDPWWNPAVEQQAIDRAHRIGQTRHVFAYRLICKDTVEQRIAELQQKKKKLADAIIGGEENLLRSLTREDLEMLLS